MTKKFLFGMMSLAMLAACTSDEIESVSVAESKGNVQFVVMNNDAATRATMNDKDAIVWSAKDGDKFTLYHGATANTNTGFQNATYKASEGEGGATLTTPSMILPGQAIMVYPADLLFDVKSSDNLSIQIPVELKDVAESIPYVSDGIEIGDYASASSSLKNTSGYNKEYPIYMRPMASQLTLKTDYAGTTTAIKALEDGEDGIEPIKVTAISVGTNDAGTTKFTQKIELDLTDNTVNSTWFDSYSYRLWGNSWNSQTKFGSALNSVATLKSTSLNGNDGCKLLFLPQTPIPATGVEDGIVTVETQYGKVVVGTTAVGGAYTSAEIADAWYRFIKKTTTEATGETKAATPETSGENKDLYKTTSEPKMGMAQTINAFSSNTKGSGVCKGEQAGAATTRYVKVLLTHLDMSELHIKSDKRLRDAVRVWKALNLPAVTVYLDGDKDKVFTMSQKTIDEINKVNGGSLKFQVMPCTVASEECTTVKIVDGGDVKDIAFITNNGAQTVKVVLAANETWNWKGAVKVQAAGVEKIINNGTMENAATATLKTIENNLTQNNVPLENNGIWNVNAGTLNVQFDVTNNGNVNIAKGAQYRQDGTKHIFTNEAKTLPKRFIGTATEKIGKVDNKGVFATVGGGEINNYGLIQHNHVDAKTYITSNEKGTGDFGTAFGTTNKMGTIELPYSNKEEDNISISADATNGFVMVTISESDAPANGVLNSTAIGTRVNYINVTGGISTIAAISTQVKYVEINDKSKEIAWTIPSASYDGLVVLSDVNVKLGTTLTAKTTYLGADMYVGGTFNCSNYAGYYGNTSSKVATNIITY